MPNDNVTEHADKIVNSYWDAYSQGRSDFIDFMLRNSEIFDLTTVQELILARLRNIR